MAFHVLPSPSRYDTSAASMYPCSSAQMSMADTKPPSWPCSRTVFSEARARMMSLKMPSSSSGSRWRPNRNVSSSGSHARNLGQARVQLVQRRSAWPQPAERLIDAAGEVFTEQGYDGVRVQDIARRAGLTTGAIYANFRNKAGLLLQTINALTAAHLGGGERTAEGETSGADDLAEAAGE